MLMERWGERHSLAVMLVAWVVSGIALAATAQSQTINDASQVARVERLIWTLGPDHPDVARALNDLGQMYRFEGPQAEAELIYKRSLAILEKALEREHQDVATALSVSTVLDNLAELYGVQGRYAEAEQHYKRSLAIIERSAGPDSVVITLSSLASLYQRQGRDAEAMPLYERSLALYEKLFPPDHALVARALNNVADAYQRLDRIAEAERLYQRSLAISENALKRQDLNEIVPVEETLGKLARLAYRGNNWSLAADFWRKSTGVLIERTGSSGPIFGPMQLAWGNLGWSEQFAEQFKGLVKANYHLAANGDSRSHAAKMFETAQWARSTKGMSDLVELLREVSVTGVDVTRLDSVKTHLVVADYSELAGPAPLSISEAQSQLRSDEALVLFLDTPEWKPVQEETFIWVVTNADVRWVRSDLGTAALRREIDALRCGLDEAAWAGEGAKRCSQILGISVPDKAPDPLPFDLARAHKLYMALFGEMQNLIKDKHLLIAPSGPLTQVPFQVLVTEPPKTAVPNDLAGYRDAAWLGIRQPITLLPSLKVLRTQTKASSASKAYLGFGNPLLDGVRQDCRRRGQRPAGTVAPGLRGGRPTTGGGA